jgi:hypothetical protein
MSEDIVFAPARLTIKHAENTNNPANYDLVFTDDLDNTVRIECRGTVTDTTSGNIYDFGEAVAILVAAAIGCDLDRH